MAVGANQLSYDALTPGTNWPVVDVQEKIQNIDPTDTPMFELSGMGTSQSIEHFWQVRTLKARAVNANLEGADFTFDNTDIPSRIGNTCQIVENGARVSNSAQAQPYYGAKDLLRDQMNMRFVEHRNDIEYSLLNATRNQGAAATARQMDGMKSAAGFEYLSLGHTFTETLFVALCEDIWLATNASPDTVLCGSKVQKEFNGFNVEGATRWVDTTTREIVNKVIAYHSSFATTMVFLTRDLTNSANVTAGAELLIFDKSMVKKAYLRTAKVYPDTASHDGVGTTLISELTLQYDNPYAIYHWGGRVIQ